MGFQEDRTFTDRGDFELWLRSLWFPNDPDIKYDSIARLQLEGG